MCSRGPFRVCFVGGEIVEAENTHGLWLEQKNRRHMGVVFIDFPAASMGSVCVCSVCECVLVWVLLEMRVDRESWRECQHVGTIYLYVNGKGNARTMFVYLLWDCCVALAKAGLYCLLGHRPRSRTQVGCSSSTSRSQTNICCY